MTKKREDNILVLFPESKRFPPAPDPVKELLEEFSHLEDEDILDKIDFSELTQPELRSLHKKLKILAKEHKLLRFYIQQIEQNLDQ